MLRGHCRVTIWPNFSIVVSQETGRPEERERDGEQPVGGAVRTCTFIKFTICVGVVHGALKQLQ